MDINGECNTLLSVTGFVCYLIAAAEEWVSLFSAGCALIERQTVQLLNSWTEIRKYFLDRDRSLCAKCILSLINVASI